MPTINSNMEARLDLLSTAWVDDVDPLRIETRSLAASLPLPCQAPDVTPELTNFQVQLRPALHSLAGVKLAVEDLREEMAALRWQLDQREQLGQLTAELAELRTQEGRIGAAIGDNAGAGQPVNARSRQSGCLRLRAVPNLDRERRSTRTLARRRTG
jgi:hypothetical protein